MEDRPSTGPGPRLSAGVGGQLSEDDVLKLSLLDILNTFLKRWPMMVGIPIVFCLVAGLLALVLPSTYEAKATLLPESDASSINLPAGLSGLASTMGLRLPMGATPPQFYAELIKSRTVLDDLLLTSFPDYAQPAERDSVHLVDLLRVKGKTQSEQLERARKKLDKAIAADADEKTRMLSLSFRSRYPALSAAVLNRAIRLLQRFNYETRASTVRARRLFMEQRLTQADNELRSAEGELRVFLERNRDYANSPELTFEHDRLQRALDVKQTVKTTLSRDYEETRIDEVNDTPMLTVIDSAIVPDRKYSPQLGPWLLVAGVMGILVGLAAAFIAELLERAASVEDQRYLEFRSRWDALRGAVSKPARSSLG